MTETPVTLYQYPRAGRLESLSPFCVKVHLALMFKGVPYRVEDCATPLGARRFNRRGRMPAADIRGERVVDSTEILEALERHFPDPPLRPDDPLQRAHARVLEDWADEVWYFYVLYWRWRIDPPDPRRVLKGMPAPLRRIGYWFLKSGTGKRIDTQGTGLKPPERVQREVREGLETIATLVDDSSTDFLLGTKRPTTADLALFAQIDGLYWKPLPRARALIESIPGIMPWYEAVNAATRGAAEARRAAAGA